ncbi:LysR family transcriptional regulator [Eoetvoesiella caeni]
MNLQQLKILKAIAMTGTIRDAAEILHLTQPAISHQLKSLEEELGESLLIRSRPKIVLLPAGLEVLAAAERVTAEIEDLCLRFSPKEPDEVTGSLRVAASTLGIVYLYGDLLQAFIQRFPKVSLVVTATESGIDGVRQLMAGLADVAFAPTAESLTGLGFTLLGETKHVAIVSSSHPLCSLTAVSAAELRKYPFIRYRPDAGSRTSSDKLFLSNAQYPPIFLESNDTEFIKRVVAMGVGTAIVPEFTVTRNDREKQHLAVLQVQHLSVAQGYGLVFRQDIKMHTVRLFRDLCIERRELTMRRF